MSIVTYGYSRRPAGVQQVIAGPNAVVQQDEITLTIQTQNLTITTTTGQVVVNTGVTVT